MAYVVMTASWWPPVVTVSKFEGWQIECLAIMNYNTKRVGRSKEPRSKVHVVRDIASRCGKTAFITALLYWDPYRFLVLQLKSTLDLKDLLLECYRARYRGWTGDSLIVAVRGKLDNQSCIVLQKAARGVPITCQPYFREYWKPRNVWIMTDSLPDLHDCKPNRWQVYNVDGNLETDIMSKLKPVKLLTDKTQMVSQRKTASYPTLVTRTN